MQLAKPAIDPLWQCLCPAWTQPTLLRAPRAIARRTRPALQCLNRPHTQQRRGLLSLPARNDNDNGAPLSPLIGYVPHNSNPRAAAVHKRETALALHRQNHNDIGDFRKEPTPYLYTRLRALAISGNVRDVRSIVEFLVQERQERPNVLLYTALIHSNVSHDVGAAWRVAEYLEEMREAGLQPDAGCCHAVLKVLSVHVDHLLRTDVLQYMQARWFQLSEDGAHDVAAGLLREGLFEQGIERLEAMRRDGVRLQPWLQDMAVYMLCAAGEVDEAYRLMRARHDGGEMGLSRTLWHTLLDAGSALRHHPSTALVWSTQVTPGYLNPSSGTCLHVLATAARAGDPVLATDVFTHLSKHTAAGTTTFQPIHYQLLLETYLASNDLNRALSILPIMALENLPITPAQTRALYAHLRSNPPLVTSAFNHLRHLHAQNRKIPIAVLNLLIELHVQQKNLPSAMSVYKQIHTFAPLGKGAQKTFANIETFNLLLRGCRRNNPPDEQQASFLVSEMLVLGVRPTSLTFDRLILVLVEAAGWALKQAEPDREKATKLLDWAFRHFVDMRAVSAPPQQPEQGDSLESPPANSPSLQQTLGWMPRFGTLERLATQLARVGDERCWDVLQAGEDHGGAVEGGGAKGKWVRKNVEGAWAKALGRADYGEAGGGAWGNANRGGGDAEAADGRVEGGEEGNRVREAVAGGGV